MGGLRQKVPTPGDSARHARIRDNLKIVCIRPANQRQLSDSVYQARKPALSSSFPLLSVRVPLGLSDRRPYRARGVLLFT